ncbi:hypothetical protein HNP46_002038 [Pseudomonas nitritireducens]|uniref:Uncharacterized protein n=1 Tax=Pseudomonas nitroreducens TaxID=46680 RepID=A0A7W7KIN8_PSENT|nr:hypothetical protein [Pseudomonas nitritireducens]MBB4863191.1 hypothetical protein [Pseudomonas nitritireducens]
MPTDLDRYYTPERVATKILEMADFSRLPSTFADSTCGSGRLLDAACNIFGNVQCAGIDRDKDAIYKLRERRPDWHLKVANLLGRKDRLASFSNDLPMPVDLLVLNPPFSHGPNKSTYVTYEKKRLKSTISMAHLLRSLDLFRPRMGAIAIVPESSLYSETDQQAREIIEKTYSFRKILDLKNCTFLGARVNASAIQLHPTHKPSAPTLYLHPQNIIKADIIRGSLPVHLMQPDSYGIPFLHSTDLKKLAFGLKEDQFPHTTSNAKGKANGWSILIPRVGLPNINFISALHLDNTIQLSDCVIALTFNDEESATIAKDRITSAWGEFYELYKGTGARYITVARLSDWLALKGIIIKSRQPLIQN